MKWSDVEVDKPHFNWITIKDWWHKTDQDGRNHNVVVIEPAKNTLICPVAIIKQYIAEVENIKHPNSPFLSQKDNLFLTRDDTCYFLKFLCKVLNIKDHLTGHSMRIGSATKITQEGEHFDIVEFAGNWNSLSYRAYIKSIALANRGLSSTIFKENPQPNAQSLHPLNETNL